MAKTDLNLVEISDSPFDGLLSNIIKYNLKQQARSIAIETAVNLENTVSLFLSQILGINLENSKSFGNTNEALSFSSKITLLKDMEIIEKDEKDILTRFMEVRNKFAHVASARKFLDCFDLIDGFSNWCKKRYGIDLSKSIEEDGRKTFESICRDIDKIMGKVFRHTLTLQMDKAISRIHNVAGELLPKYFNNLDGLCVKCKQVYNKIYDDFLVEFKSLKANDRNV